MFVQREMTAEEFLAFADQHPDQRFDFIDGEIVEVSPKPIHSKKQARIAGALDIYLEDHPQIGVVYTEVLVVLNGEKFLPDVCVAQDSEANYLTEPPLLAVEIRSDSQSRAAQRRKVRAYLKHGVKMAVLVLPGDGIEVHRPDKEVIVLTAEDTFDGEDVLPGFKLPLKRILP
jgi:Uma2 family endonuclease